MTDSTDYYDDDYDDFWDDPNEYAITHPLCVDCRIELLPDTPPGSKDWQQYMVHNQVWADAGIDRGWICIPCLETRLGRPLTGADFPAHLPINEPGRYDETHRLADLKRSAAVLANQPTKD